MTWWEWLLVGISYIATGVVTVTLADIGMDYERFFLAMIWPLLWVIGLFMLGGIEIERFQDWRKEHHGS